jgi:hypothetical protein
MKKILVWKYHYKDSFLSGAIIVDEVEYKFWLDLLKKQDTPFSINIVSNLDQSIVFSNGEELLESVNITEIGKDFEESFIDIIGEGIGILNFYTDVVSDLDNSDFIIDMNDTSEEVEE